MTEEKKCENDPKSSKRSPLEVLQGPCFEPPQISGRWWRESERQTLMEIYQQAATTTTRAKQVVLLSGSPGSGKRTLMQAFSNHVHEQGGLVLRLVNDNSRKVLHPHASLLQGMLRFAMDTLQRNDPIVLKRIKKQDFTTVNDGGQFQRLIETVPVFSQLFGSDSSTTDATTHVPVPLTSHEEARLLDGLTPFFRYSFIHFLEAISNVHHPTVVMVENFQWSSEALLQVLGSVVRDTNRQGLVFVVLFPPNKNQSRLFSVIQKLQDCGPHVARVHKISLDQNNKNEYQDSLRLQQQLLVPLLGPMEDMDTLSNFITKHLDTETNSTSTTTSLVSLDYILSRLVQSKWLFCDNSDENDNNNYQWTFDPPDQIMENEHESLNLAEMILAQASCMLAIPEQKELLQFLVCLGSETSVDILTALGDSDTCQVVLQHLKEAKLLNIQQDDNKDIRTISFSHDFVRHVLYHSVSEPERAFLHYRLARCLWKSHQEREQQNNHKNDHDDIDDKNNAFQIDKSLVCIVLDHLGLGREFIKSSRERFAIAQLCLNAAQMTVKISSFYASYRYLKFGLSLVKEEPRRWRDEYDLCLELYNAAAELSLCTTQHDDVDELAEEVCQNALCYEDTLQARSAQIYSIGTRGKAVEAVSLACEVLSQLGINLPMHPSAFLSQLTLWKTGKILRGKSDEFIKRLPPMRDHEKLSAMKVLTILFSHCFSVNPLMAPMIAYESIRLTLEHGISSISSVGFVLYGAILCRMPSQASLGYRFGTLAMSIQSRYHVDIWSGRVCAIFYGGVYGWKRDFRGAVKHVQLASRQCLLVGDKEFAMRIANVCISCQLDLTPLPELVKIIKRARVDMIYHRDLHNLSLTIPIMYTFLKLSGRSDGDYEFLKEAENIVDQLKSMHTSSGVAKWGWYSLMMISYLFGQYEEAFAHSEGAQGLLRLAMGAGDSSVTFLYDGLINVELARTTKLLKRRYHIQRAKKRLHSLQNFAHAAPGNFLGKACLLRAELAALAGNHKKAYTNYASSIALSKEGGFFVGTALAQERAGKYFLSIQDDEFASKYVTEAVARYSEYGADAKANYLVAEIRGKGINVLI